MNVCQFALHEIAALCIRQASCKGHVTMYCMSTGTACTDRVLHKQCRVTSSSSPSQTVSYIGMATQLALATSSRLVSFVALTSRHCCPAPCVSHWSVDGCQSGMSSPARHRATESGRLGGQGWPSESLCLPCASDLESWVVVVWLNCKRVQESAGECKVQGASTSTSHKPLDMRHCSLQI